MTLCVREVVAGSLRVPDTVAARPTLGAATTMVPLRLRRMPMALLQ